MADGLKVDLTRFSAELKNTSKLFATATRKRTRAAFLEAGADMISRIRSGASWSSRIPAAVKLQTTFSARSSKVKVLVDAKQAPHARPLEVGNRSNFDEGVIASRTRTIAGIQVGRRAAMAAMKREGVGVSRMLRHPVWDSEHPARRWSSMPTRPFFFPAATAEAARAEEALDLALEQIAHDSGFH